jgi:glycosyltransferase involved in cell wall biosynthesis
MHPENDGRLIRHIDTCRKYFDDVTYFRINTYPKKSSFHVYGDMVEYIEYDVSKNNSLGRYAKLVTHAGRFLNASANISEYDVIHAHDPQSLIVGAYVKKRTGAPLVYDRHEYWDDSFYARHNAILERIFSKYIDCVACITEDMASSLPLYFRKKYAIVTPNFPQKDLFDEKRIDTKIDGVKQDDSVKLCYYGFMDKERTTHLFPLLERLSCDKRIVIELGGRGPFAPAMAAMARKNVIFLGEVPYSDVLWRTSESHFGFIFTDFAHRRKTSNNKLHEYMLAGVVPIAKINEDGYSPEWPIDLMNEKSFEEIYAYVMRLIEDRDTLSKKMTEIRRFGETRTWKTCEKRYYDLYDRLVGR